MPRARSPGQHRSSADIAGGLLPNTGNRGVLRSGPGSTPRRGCTARPSPTCANCRWRRLPRSGWCLEPGGGRDELFVALQRALHDGPRDARLIWRNSGGGVSFILSTDPDRARWVVAHPSPAIRDP